MNAIKTLSREGMRDITAGYLKAPETVTCKEFHEISGCYPAPGGNECEGKDGKIYKAATSSGSYG